MGSTQLCRLCLQASDDVLNIWETFLDSTIAAILAKHFWFQVHEDDGLAESICEMCWIHTKEFHEFYRRVEQFQKCVSKSTEENHSAHDETIHIVHIKQELNVDKCEEVEMDALQIDTDCEDVDTKPDLNGIEYEEVEMDSLQISSSEYEDDEVETERTMNDDDQCLSNANDDNRIVKANVKRAYPPKNPELEAQIHELFVMKCDICRHTVEFKALSDARQHYRKVHKTRSYLICCDKKFYKRFAILDHIRWHTDSDPYKCTECGKRFWSNNGLKTHMQHHVPNESRTINCSLCLKKFVKEHQLKKHMNEKHASTEGIRYGCGKCVKTFPSKMQLYQHNRAVHEMVDNVCDVCARRFKSKSNLQQHIDHEHLNVPQPKFQCDICGIWLKCLKAHRRLHKERVPVNCPICNKLVQDKRSLNEHIRYSHAERRHQCQLCDKAFKCAINLKEHLAIHTGEDLYDCPYCEKKFKSNANMYSHRKKAHLAEWTRDFSQRTTQPVKPSARTEEDESKI
ncbi:transcription factor grauzone-like isoform X3 [Bradysia coprophila]|uniref:transcription factor grauzone-like isoform X3 n=1 Tax=Bradysia coprophila TaxID=38358 RepID=UPI00187DCFB4|nr:transcription factor grauzone-like isoform X3 [Bradysia coprophila]